MKTRGSKIVSQILWTAVEEFWTIFPRSWEGRSHLLCLIQNSITRLAEIAEDRI